MNRRQFGKLVGGAAAAVPLPKMAIAAPSHISTRGTYAWAVAMAKSQDRASPALLQQSLRVPADVAQRLYDKLLARGVISAPDATGVSRAVAPIFRSSFTVPVPAVQPAARVVQAEQPDLRKVVDVLTKDGSVEPPEEDKLTASDDAPALPEVSDAEHSAE